MSGVECEPRSWEPGLAIHAIISGRQGFGRILIDKFTGRWNWFDDINQHAVWIASYKVPLAERFIRQGLEDRQPCILNALELGVDILDLKIQDQTANRPMPFCRDRFMISL